MYKLTIDEFQDYMIGLENRKHNERFAYFLAMNMDTDILMSIHNEMMKSFNDEDELRKLYSDYLKKF